VTFKDLRKIIAERNKEMERESKFYNPSYFWKGRKVVSLDQWFQIKENYALKAALQYFPNDFPSFGFSYILDNIEDQMLKQEAEQWYSDFIKLMEYSKNAKYGKTKCFRCLLSPDREEAAIFIGINKVISRALDTTEGVSVYPCKVLNRFACPYDKKIVVGSEEDITEDSIAKKPDVNQLFYLSELAFVVELALAKAQEEGSIFRIKSAEDVYQVLTNKEPLEVVLQQGLKEEHMQYKDRIVDFFMNMKDRIKVEDLRVY
jgi:hypothetical protein